MTSETLEWVRRNRPDIEAVEELDGACGVKNCNRAQFETFPICEQHAFDIWLEVGFFRMDVSKAAGAHIRKGVVEKTKAELINEALGIEKFKAEQRANKMQAPGTIYYLQIEDKIKIGYTQDLGNRLKQYPPMARLLATHPGTFQLEADMHRKFSVYLSDRREWFVANAELTAHIERIHKDFKQDKRVAA